MACSVFAVKTKPFIVDTCPLRSEIIFAPRFQWAQKKLKFFGPIFRNYASKSMTNAVMKCTGTDTKCTLCVKICLGCKNQTVHRMKIIFFLISMRIAPRFQWWKKICQLIIQIFRKIVSKFGDFSRFFKFLDFIKVEVLKWL